MITKAQENLFKCLSLFIEALRPWAVDFLAKRNGGKWEDAYYATLAPPQRNHWDINRSKVDSADSLIDFSNLKGFSLGCKTQLVDAIGKDAQKLPTWFDELSDARNKCQHFQDMTEFDVQRAFGTMILIADKLGLSEVKKEITALQEDRRDQISAAKKPLSAAGAVVPWFQNVLPHADIRQGTLDESVFAANLMDVVRGTAREIYQNPILFFSKTFFTAGLSSIARRVFQGLGGGQDAENRVLSLQTGFGGGKTHTLIALYHLAALGSKIEGLEGTKDLVAKLGGASFGGANVAVFTNSTNDPVQGRFIDAGTTLRTMWGELAWKLGGKEAYEIIRPNDEERTAPKGLFRKVLESCAPCLILVDELADYCIAASGVSVGASSLADQTTSFVQELTEAVAGMDRCVLVATLPASVAEVASSARAAEILNSLQLRLARVGSDTKPVADEEIFEVIRRRLFEDLGDESSREAAVSAYSAMYQQLWVDLPANAGKLEYRETLRKSYPFHPELIDMFRIRWAGNHYFQRTRGVLRILASIVADLWKRQQSLSGSNVFIHTSDVVIANLDALTGQIVKLKGNGYDAVIAADISGNASNALKIDREHPEFSPHNLAQGIAITILLGSVETSGSNQGIGLDEIKLCVLKPGAFNHNSVNGALDQLEARAHYLYNSSIGSTQKRYWFQTKPNINILIMQAKGEVTRDAVHAELLKRIEAKANTISQFNVLVNPSGEVPEQKRPTLVILGPQCQDSPDRGEASVPVKIIVERIATLKGNAQRIYRNTLLFLVCNELSYGKLSTACQEYLACVSIRNEYGSRIDETQRLDLGRRIEESTRAVNGALSSAYSLVLKYSAKEGIQKLAIKSFKDQLDLQISAVILPELQKEEWLLDRVGLATLKNANLLPTPGKPIKARDIHEAFLRFDDKPMIMGPVAIQESLLRYCQNGEFAIATGTAGAFTSFYVKENVPFFDVSDDTYWVVDNSDVPEKKTPDTAPPGTEKPEENENGGETGKPERKPGGGSDDSTTVFRSVTVSGRVDVVNYHQVFTSFIGPLAYNDVTIEIRISGKSLPGKAIAENSDQYRIIKESASQLGLELKTE